MVITACRETGESRLRCPSTTGNGPDDEKGFFPRCNCVGQWGIRRLEGIVFLASEKTQERTTLLRDVIADGAVQHRILRLESVEHRALRNRALDVQLDLGA